MKRLPILIILLLSLSLSLSLISCGASESSGDFRQRYREQASVKATIYYNVTFDACIGEEAFNNLSQQFTADVLVDLISGHAYVHGYMDTLVSEEVVGTTEVESYAVPDDLESPAYYRYGNIYYADSAENSFLTMVNAPSVLNASEYEKAEHAEVLYGTVCDVYTGTEIADDSDQSFVAGLVEGDVSLYGCLMDVEIRVYQETGLPAQLFINYSNLEEMDISFSDASGNSYSLTGLRYEIYYHNYGSTVDVYIPDEFKENAVNGVIEQPEAPNAELPIISEENEKPDSSEITSLNDLVRGTITEYSGDPDANFSNSTVIYNENSSCFYVIDTPEYMQKNSSEANAVSYYYCYSDEDIEFIDYILYSNCTMEEEAAFAESLPDYYAQDDSVSNVSDSGISTLSIGDYEVNYIVILFSMEDSGVTYECIDVYSWIQAPNGVDILDVDIYEYNASGDGLFFDVEEELIYAYKAIMGSGFLKVNV